MPSLSMLTTPPREGTLEKPIYAIPELRGHSHRLLWWILLTCERDRYTGKWHLPFRWQDEATRATGFSNSRRLREAMLNLERCGIIARERLRKRQGYRVTLNRARIEYE